VLVDFLAILAIGARVRDRQREIAGFAAFEDGRAAIAGPDKDRALAPWAGGEDLHEKLLPKGGVAHSILTDQLMDGVPEIHTRLFTKCQRPDHKRRA
jgi:hypothetical protein